MARWIVVGALVAAAVVAGCTSGGESADPTTTSTTRFEPPIVSSTAPSTTTTQPTTTSTTTIPEPPHLEVLDPAHGATVTTARYTFTGVTDPGCTVTVGARYEAAVGEDGSWSLDLMLEPGRNSTTFTATHPETGLETAAHVAVVYAPIVLKADGLGVVSFGDPMEDAIATLTDLLGPSSGDRLTEAPFGEEGEMGGGQMACWTATGTTCIDYLRVVSWDAHGLYVVFSDWTEPAPGAEDWELTPVAPNLRGYAYFGGTDESVLATTDGVTIGATVDDLANAYGNRLRFSYDECAFNIAGFEVFDHANDDAPNSNSGINWGLWGELSGLPEAPESAVTSFGARSLLGHC